MGLGVRRVSLTRRWGWFKLIALCSLLALGGALAERSMSAGVRRRSLEKARASSPGGALVAVDDVKFDRFITGVPRQYEAVVFFTATGASYKCASCRVHLDEFTVMAESYKAARQNSPEALKGVDIFFFVADFGRTQRSFQQLGLQSVPKIMHFPPSLAEGEGGRYSVDPSQHMAMAGKSTAEEMARFVKDRTGAVIPIVRAEPPVAIVLCVLLVLAILAIKPLLANLGALIRTVRNKYLWLTISLMVYTFGISGGVYDIIRNPAMFTLKQDGTPLWFHPQANVQFVAEGFITGVMTLMCGMSGILLVHVAPKMSSQLSRHVMTGACGVAFLMLFINVLKLYRSKNPWYRPL
eukprot:jgi/Undpi1/5092/HiC_scaffold_19.g08444.m1